MTASGHERPLAGDVQFPAVGVRWLDFWSSRRRGDSV